MHVIRLVLVSALALAACDGKKNADAGAAPPAVDDGTNPDRTVVDTGPGDASSDGPLGAPISGISRGGTVVPDAAPAAVVDAAAPDVPGANSSCDLLLQDCPGKAYGCYPLSNGTGRCQAAGSVGENGQCVLGDDPPSCQPGLTCMSTASVAGVCLRLCDLSGASTNLATTCPADQPCRPLHGSTKVGFCSP
jgi:hypothetical protein